MKKLFTFLLAVLITAINASATAELSPDGKTLTLTNFVEADVVVNNNAVFTDEQLEGVKTLIIVGSIGSTNKFKDNVASKVTGLEELDMSGMNADAVAPNKDGIGAMSSIKTIIFPNALQTIPAELCKGFEHLTSVSLPDDLKTIEANAFQKCSALQSITFPYGLKTIGATSFANSGLTSVSIPGTVTSIGATAFTDNLNLKSVTFEEAQEADRPVDMTIASYAFQNADKVLNVYVETEGTIHCGNEAFSISVTTGHSDVNSTFATLHYPLSKADEYVNRNHVLTPETLADAGRFQSWLSAHMNLASSAQNGWFEFIHSGPSNDPDAPAISETFLQTWSEYGEEMTGYTKTDGNNILLSTSYNETEGYTTAINYYLARMVPDGVRAYIVNDIQSSSSDSYTVRLKRLRVIPPNTGVILYGQSNSKTSGENPRPILLMTQVPYTGKPMTRENWTDPSNTEFKNFLIGTANEAKNSVHVLPYEPKDGTAVQFRNFYLADFKTTDTYKNNKVANGWENVTLTDDYVGFFRAKESYMSSGKAYLHLKYDEFKSAAGNECIIAADDEFNYEYVGANFVKKEILWGNRAWNGLVSENNWGDREKYNNIDEFLASYRGEFENEVNGIVTLTVPSTEINEFYTLQGVRVSQPTKGGIYIKNGKKIVVK